MADEPVNKPLPTESELKSQVDAVLARLGVSKGAPEATTEGEPDQPDSKGSPEKDADAPINWDDYELAPELAHLYRKSEIVATESGTQILAPWFQMRYETAGRKDIGRIEQLVNGQEQWQIAAIIPNGYNSVAFVLQRLVKRALPVPDMIVTETKTDEPTDDELANTEASALAWAGQTPLADAAAEEAAAATDGAVEGADVTTPGVE